MIFKINNQKIQNNKPPFIIGEISANHCKSLENIYNLLKIAKKIKLNAIKIQTFDPNEMTIDSPKKKFQIREKFSDKTWNNRSLYSIYEEACLPFDMHKKIFYKAKKIGIFIFSSVFDDISLRLLEKLNCPAYKIASLESLHFPLIEKVIKTKKPIIISTGALNIDEIKEIKFFFKKKKFNNFAVLHCVTEYPAQAHNLNLKTIPHLKKIFKNNPVGFSDHTNNFISSIAAVSNGATIIEKHFKLDNKSDILDSKFSLTPDQMHLLINNCNYAWRCLGKIKSKVEGDEKIYRNYQRSIYATNFIAKGEKFTKKNIKIVRPSGGLKPKYYKKILNKISQKKYFCGDPIKF